MNKSLFSCVVQQTGPALPNGNQPSFCVQSVVVGKEDTEDIRKKRKKTKCKDECYPSDVCDEIEETEEYTDEPRRSRRRGCSRGYFDPIYNFRFGGRGSLCGSLFDSPLLCRRFPPPMCMEDHMDLPLF